MPPNALRTPPSTGDSVELLRQSIEALVADRQRLRESGAGPAALEANRRDIVRCQWHLAAALLASRAG
jgi:hypothetical protein